MKKLRVGDLVRYSGANHTVMAGPIGLIVDERSIDSDYHHRIRVTWAGTVLPIQAHVLSVDGSWTTRWLKPSTFHLVEGDDESR